jgi:hypothetical protein
MDRFHRVTIITIIPTLSFAHSHYTELSESYSSEQNTTCFYRTRILVVVFKRAFSEPHHPNQPPTHTHTHTHARAHTHTHTHISLRSILILLLHLRFSLPYSLFPSGLPSKMVYAFVSSLCVLHIPPFSSSFI